MAKIKQISIVKKIVLYKKNSKISAAISQLLSNILFVLEIKDIDIKKYQNIAL